MLLAEGHEVAFRHRSKVERQEKREQPYDLLIVENGGGLVVEEDKTTAAGPFSDFGPAKREALLRVAASIGAVARLCWWPYDGKGPRIFYSEDWPDAHP